jgi:hypothetical protein
LTLQQTFLCPKKKNNTITEQEQKMAELKAFSKETQCIKKEL